MDPQSASLSEASVNRRANFSSRDVTALHKTPVAYSIDEMARQVSVRFTGKLSFNVIAKYADNLAANPQFDPTYGELVDLRLVETVALTARELIKLADEVDPFARNSKRAFVAQNQAQIHAANVHHLLRPDSKNMRIFISLQEAEQWLRSE